MVNIDLLKKICAMECSFEELEKFNIEKILFAIIGNNKDRLSGKTFDRFCHQAWSFVVTDHDQTARCPT